MTGYSCISAVQGDLGAAGVLDLGIAAEVIEMAVGVYHEVDVAE